MLGKRAMRVVLITLATVVAAIIIFSSTALAQCAMCKASAAAAASNGAKNLNLAVLVLLVPPVGMFCAIFAAAFKRRKAPDEKSDE